MSGPRRFSLVLLALVLALSVSCCSTGAGNPQPFGDWESFAIKHVTQWLDMRLDPEDAASTLHEKHPVHCACSQSELVEALAPYGNAVLLMEQLRRTALFPDPPPTEAHFVGIIRGAVLYYRDKFLGEYHLPPDDE